MRRNRPPRRPFRRPSPRGVPPELRHANELLENGEYAEAAVAFEKIAKQADRRRGPRAPHFHLRAGQAYILCDEADKGMAHIRQGLGAIAARKHWEPFQRLGQRVVDELNGLGHTKEADEILAYITAKLPDGRFTPSQAREFRPTHPTHCSGCGAPVRADEVEWIDLQTAECIYCGNPIRGE